MFNGVIALLGQPEDPAPDAPSGPEAPSGPSLPDVVPQGVHDLVGGLFGALDDAAGGIGDLVSGLAEAIGGGAGEATPGLVSAAIDLAVVLT